MKFIQLLLLFFGYASLLPFNAEWIGTLDNTCLVVVFGPVELLSPILGIVLLLGYSTAVSGKIPWNSPKAFWATSVAFNSVFPIGAFYLFRHDSITHLVTGRIEALHRSLTPFDSAFFIESLGGISIFFILFWMPIAAALSLVALVLVCRQHTYNTVEQGAAANP